MRSRYQIHGRWLVYVFKNEVNETLAQIECPVPVSYAYILVRESMFFCGRGKAEGTYRSNLSYLICFVWLWERPRDALKENVANGCNDAAARFFSTCVTDLVFSTTLHSPTACEEL